MTMPMPMTLHDGQSMIELGSLVGKPNEPKSNNNLAITSMYSLQTHGPYPVYKYSARIPTYSGVCFIMEKDSELARMLP